MEEVPPSYLARTPCVPLFHTLFFFFFFYRGGNKRAFKTTRARRGSCPLYGGTFALSYLIQRDLHMAVRAAPKIFGGLHLQVSGTSESAPGKWGRPRRRSSSGEEKAQRAQFVPRTNPACPWDKPGSKGSRKSLYVLKVYVRFSLARRQFLTRFRLDSG